MNLLSPDNLPESIGNEEQLEELLTRPTAALVQAVKSLSSPLLVLGAGGKMGPTLAVLAKRAAQAAGHPLEVIAVSRFSNTAARASLERQQVRTLSCDLLDASALKQLPEANNLIYMVGLKFGSTQNPASTWAINTIVPVRVAERYPRARVVALSTGNVYPMSDPNRGGSIETDPLTPLGEYANSAVARERLFQFYSGCHETPIALIRLFYAVEMRYGVPLDIARKVFTGEPIELANGHFNCIWQGDANEMILRSLGLAEAPPSVWNLCRPEVFQVRAVAARLGELLGRRPQFSGTEAPSALLGNAERLCRELGLPNISLECMLRWIADWVKQGGCSLGKPTHFEVRDGKY